MHRIAFLQLKNYRSCKDISFDFADYTPLVGQNNVGKSNIIRGLSWLLKKESLAQGDFFDSSQPVVAIGRIEGITQEILDRLDPKHKAAIEKYIDGEKLWIQQEQKEAGASVRDIKLNVLKVGGDYTKDDDWAKNPGGISAAISGLFPDPLHIHAMVDAAEDAGKFKSNTTIGRLLAEIVGAVVNTHGAALVDAIAQISRILGAEGDTRAQELQDIDKAANAILHNIFPDIQVRTHVSPPTPESLFKTGGTIQVSEPALGRGWSNIDTMGHGAQRSVQMALIQCLAERRRPEDASTLCTLLLIDEPELYLHPQAIEQVRSALKKLSKSGYQVVFSTHSPLLIEMDDVPATFMIYKGQDGGTARRKTVAQAFQETSEAHMTLAELLFSLDNTSQILFCERALLAEGITEKRLIPALYTNYCGRSLGMDKIALVPVDGKDKVSPVLKLLIAMGIPTRVIADMDCLVTFGEQCGFIAGQNTDFQACKAYCAQNGLNPDKADDCKIVCQDTNMQLHVVGLHQQAKQSGLWFWPDGDIEAALGLTGKKSKHHAEFLDKLDLLGFQGAIQNHARVIECLDWIATA